MNLLRSWLYGHNTHNVQNQSQTFANQANENPQFNNVGEKNDSINSVSPVKTAMLKYIPLAPGDCLECKLVGSSVMMLSGVLVITSAIRARKSNPKLRGINGIVYALVCCSLFLGFETAAYCRLFDKRIFEKSSSK